MAKSLHAGEQREHVALRIWLVLAIVVSLANPAFGQGTSKAPPQPQPGGPAKSAKEIESDKSNDRAYQKSLGNIPDKPPADPWGGARATETPKTTAKAK